MTNPLPDRPLPTTPVTPGLGGFPSPVGHLEAPPRMDSPVPEPIEEPADASYQNISWRVTGWDPDAPFRGELQFTGSSGELLLSLPVDPSTMQSLNEITDVVLDAQHEAFGIAPREGDYLDDEPTDEETRRRFRLPGKDIGEERTVVDKEFFGVPFRMNVRPKALSMLGMLGGGILLIAFLANLVS